MKAIIPVAGAGIRLRPHTYTQPKPLILVAGKPIISFIIDQLRDAGIEDFVFVLGYMAEKIKGYLETEYPTLSKEYVYQQVRRGLGDAILKTKDCIENEDSVVILLGDTILDLNFKDFLDDDYSCLATQKVQDPRLFGVVEKDGTDWVKRLIEKPSIPKSNLAIAGLYKINEVKLMLESLEEIDNDNRHDDSFELQLTDGLMRMIDNGAKIKSYPVSHWYDCGKKDILLETNRVLLEKQSSDVGTEFMYDHTILIPPVVFGSSCTFKNSIIGPHVTLGDHVNVENSLLSNSIIGNYVEIKGAVLSKSVIGNDAVIKGLSQSLNIGDNNEIDFTQ